MYWYLPLAWTLSFWDGLLAPPGFTVQPLGPDELDDAAELHSAAFAGGWSGDEFASLLAQGGTFGFAVRRDGQPKPIGIVLARLTVDEAWAFFAEEPSVRRALTVLREVGLGYLRLGQSATELSGGEAQRIKLATELQRQARAHTLYVLDEPTTGLHPADVERLLTQLNGLVEAGHSVLVVEHDMRVVAGADWVIDVGPGAGEEGGRIVAAGPPAEVARAQASRTAPYLAKFLTGG